MKNGKIPDPNVIHPISGYDKEIYVKPTVKSQNIIVGDFTYTCYKIINGNYCECKLEGDEDYFTNIYLGQPYEVDANAYAYEQVKRIYGDSDDLRKLYEFWMPSQPVPDDVYDSVYALIDERIQKE